MSDLWTIRAALDWTQGYLERRGDESPRVSAQWLLAEATGLRRLDLYTHLDQPLSTEERDVLRDYVQRRGMGEPLQYITGEVGFRHIVVKVRPGVLIPRPETEVLVSEGLSLLAPAPRPRAVDEDTLSDNETGEEPTLLVADLCTGSGCIACSMAYEHPLVHVVATDIAPEATALARANAASLDLSDRVEVMTCDLGEGIDDGLMGAFDLILSNPPYVPTGVLDGIPPEVVDYEPSLALDGGLDGLDVFRPLLAFCRHALKPEGGFACELHETCLSEAARLAAGEGFTDVRIVADLAGRPRVLTARMPGGIE